MDVSKILQSGWGQTEGLYRIIFQQLQLHPFGFVKWKLVWKDFQWQEIWVQTNCHVQKDLRYTKVLCEINLGKMMVSKSLGQIKFGGKKRKNVGLRKKIVKKKFGIKKQLNQK